MPLYLISYAVDGLDEAEDLVAEIADPQAWAQTPMGQFKSALTAMQARFYKTRAATVEFDGDARALIQAILDPLSPSARAAISLIVTEMSENRALHFPRGEGSEREA